MSELGALLELIHDAHSRVATLEAEYRDWARPRPNLRLSVERAEFGETRAHWRGAGPFPKVVANTRRIWLEAPVNLRVEIVNGRQLARLGVLTSERWWRWDRDSGVISGELDPGQEIDWAPTPPLLAPPLVNPARLLATLRFEAIGSGVRIKRNVIAARALPRRVSPTGRALSYEFEFDAQHGTILRRAALDDGQVVSLTEATAVTYDRPIEPERFVFTSPDGQATRSPRPTRDTASGRRTGES